MSNKLFTDEEVQELSMNPNVESVTKKSVRFNRNFKQALRRSLDSGVKVEEFLQANGINPETLGKTRIRGLINKAESSEESDSFSPFSNRDGVRYIVPEKNNLSELKRIRDLEVKVAFLEQELAFLKKIVQANLEVQKNLVYEQDQV